MAGLAVKPEYGPTLGHLLAPRWRTASKRARVLAAMASAVALVLAIALVLTLLNASYSHAGRVPFSFSYRGLYKVVPEPGGYVRLHRRWRGGALEYSFAVDPLTLPRYTGTTAAAVAVYASGYIRRLEREDAGFSLRGEGKTMLTKTVAGYQVAYTARVEGRPMLGRNILLLPQTPGAREGVTIVMLMAPGANSQVTGPIEVATTGILLRPLKTFSVG